MKKVSVSATNDICPQTLFVYGSMNEDGTPDFGLFCWFSYCWFDRLGVICAIGGSKRTLENIRRNGVFSANLVVEDNLPLADYFGTADGRDSDKMDIAVEWEKGAVLTVPVLCSSPISFELEVDKEIVTGERDKVVLLCHIRNTLKDERLINSSMTSEEIFKTTAAVRTCVDCDYWSWDGRHLGKWHERAKEINRRSSKTGMTNMEIRAFCNEDILGICSLINSELGYDVSCEDLKTRISQMQEDKNYVIFTAVEDKKIIGFIGLQIGLVFEIKGKIMRIIALAVDSHFQGQGIGSALIQAVEEYADENNISAIVVNSGLRRIEGHRFYEKQSFYKKGYSFCKRVERGSSK